MVQAANVIIIPHGSLVEYLGSTNFKTLEVPTFGNRGILHWESSRQRQRDWLEAGGCEMPKVLEDPHDIDGPVIVKYAGAKGGRGYFIAGLSRFGEMSTLKRNLLFKNMFLVAAITYISSDPIAEDGYQVQGKGKYAGKNPEDLSCYPWIEETSQMSMSFTN
ncbi:MAG: hypothetical protein CM15mP47_4580 [Methanobacteriota archaeon]|nr:MAG: hypothetical protein CM15mP47_4580 [Euryarchaeota archaeon]